MQRLFQYISGTNEEEAKIEMTAPVRVLLTAGEGPFCESFFKISFFVPYALQVGRGGNECGPLVGTGI